MPLPRKVLICFSISIQLAAFFIVLSLLLWIDQLADGPIVSLARHAPLYRGVSITVVPLTTFWLILGWLCVRREHVIATHIFLSLTLIFLTVFLSSYASPMYRFTVEEWPFFSACTSVAVVFLVAALGFGTWRRLSFGKGLLEACECDSICFCSY